MLGIRTLVASAGLAVGLMVAMPAQAQMITANAASIAGVLRAKGLTVEVTTDKDGDPRLTTSDGGIKFEVWFYGCTAHKNCTSAQFYAGFTDTKMDALKLNDWNRSHRFGRAYIDSDGDPAVEMDIDLDDGGMPRPLFEDNLEFWATTMTAFEKFVYPE